MSPYVNHTIFSIQNATIICFAVTAKALSDFKSFMPSAPTSVYRRDGCADCTQRGKLPINVADADSPPHRSLFSLFMIILFYRNILYIGNVNKCAVKKDPKTRRHIFSATPHKSS
jgi:hypothetical protein